MNKAVPAGIALVSLVAMATTSSLQPNQFEDITERAGIHFLNQASHTSRKYLPETMVGGVALFDYNNDGLLDIFFVNGAALQDPMPAGAHPDKRDPKYWNRLYRNNGDGTFTDVTEKAGVQGSGYGMGVAVADFDNDGYEDLYVTNVGENILYRNNGDGTFTDVTAAAGVAAGLVFGLGGALVSAVLAKRQKLRPFAGADRRAEVVLVVRIVAAAVAGIAIGQGLVHLSGSAVLGHLIGGAVIFLLACAAGGAYMNAGVPGDLAQAASPDTALARDRRAAFSAAVMFGFGLVLLVGTLVGIPVGVLVGLVPGLVFGFAFPVFIGLCLSLLPAAWLSYALVRGWLALHRRLPWSLMDFLADAHQRGVLEQVGSVYRFRHTDLQHRLATRPRPTANSL